MLKFMENKINSVEFIETESMKESKIFFEAVSEMIAAYIDEAVEHFLSQRPRSIKDDGRYFYSKEELISFKEKFTEGGGTMADLHIGIVYTSNREFLCFEVCREKFYNLDSLYLKNKYRGEQLFFS